MLFRALDSQDDWIFGKGINSFTTGRDAMILNIKTRIKQWKGECFFDIQGGVDWNNFLDIGTKDLLDADLHRVILASDGVIRIDGYTSTLDTITRTISVEATLFTVYGTMPLSEEF